ncbi:AAA family ATPase [Chamaesiphon polymorphus]|uniref:Abortive infection protein n=1 Tax=Chamaesiphon polymorphus CCALA 037 TaxID=2107692 RepID=A0A2T1FRQ2_9CYAN|nr:abortive infection protein [Chamaesiphon polymorphus CCALA 037]
MLIEFSVGNYRSFKEKVTFSMVAANLVSQDKDLDINNVFAVDKELSLVKSAAIYGANASGKSNLAKAIQFMKWFMVNSSKETQSTEAIGVERFKLSTETDDQPSFFEIVFLLDGQQHRYGFTADREKVVSEWLYYVPKTRETKLFDRQGNKFDIAKVYKADGIATKTRSNALFLSVSAQFNVQKSEDILSWLTEQFNLISGLDDEHLNITIGCLIEKENHGEIVELVQRLDFGIAGIEVEQFNARDVLNNVADPQQKKILKMLARNNVELSTVATTHLKFNEKGEQTSLEKFDIANEESDGTQKIFALSSLLIDTLKHAKVLIIDEFDARLHPLMSKAIVDLFNSNETNPKNAQLIFMTHDTNLLSNKIFRRDQIWFTEKDRYGATDLYSLAEYKVRNDASFESDYIKGKYGAIPYIQIAESFIETHA